MNPSSPSFPAASPGAHWSARHSRHDCPDCCVEGAAPQNPGGVAPTLVSTAAPVPIGASAPEPLTPAMAVLTIFEGQAVFRVTAGNTADLPTGTLFRLRKGLREVTGGVRW